MGASAPTLAPSDVASAESTLRHLELRVLRKLDGLLHGDHLGLVPAAGTEAGAGRLYVPGDDVRRIDWNLTARSGVPHVRDTVADRELETWLVVDGSASLDFGTARFEKRDLALAAAAAFGFLTSRSGNRFGAVIFDGDGEAIVPPRAGREAMLGFLRRLERRPRSAPGRASLASGLRTARLVARRRGLVVVVSDFLDADGWVRELRSLGAHHDVVVCRVADPREFELPPVGLLTFVDPESGRRVEVQTARRDVRERFAAAAQRQCDDTRAAVRSARAAYLELSTDRDWMLDVIRFVSLRRRMR